MILSPAYERYHVFVCSDCHPDYNDEDTPEDERYELPFEIVLPIDGERVRDDGDPACPIEHCPRCQSYLSMCSAGVVTLERAR